MPRNQRLIPVLFVLLIALLTSWAWAVLVAGRALPWQADRLWALAFAAAFLVAALRGWRYWADISKLPGETGRERIALAWGAGPTAVVAVAFLGAAYLSNGFYGFLLLPFYRMQLLAGAVVAMALLESLLVASTVRLLDDRMRVRSALMVAVARRRSAIVWVSLVAVGALQAAATASPIGDDLGQYATVAQALLDGKGYPVHYVGAGYVSAGFMQSLLVMPMLPMLLTISFAVFGKTLAGVAVAFAVLKAALPAAVYAAARELTGSKIAAYATAILLTLFPIYQLHVVSAPEPDTLFAILALLVVFLAAKAHTTMRWPFWAAMGIVGGLLAETRWEGIVFASAALLIFCALQRPTRLYWVLLSPFLLVLAPFAIASLSLTGKPWSTSVGALSPSAVMSNLTILRDVALPWYVQAVGLEAPTLALLIVAMGLGVAATLLMLWKTRRPLVFVPLLGAGYVVASLLINPEVLNPSSPVDVFRHWSTGIPYVALSLAYVIHSGYRTAARRLASWRGLALGLVGVSLVAGIIYYDCERLARPEWQFGGHARLLWTGGGYLLADVLRNPVPLPAWNDPRPGEVLRAEQSKPLEPFSLRTTNASEPYDWTTLMVALFGLAYAASPALAGTMATGKRPAEHPVLVSG